MVSDGVGGGVARVDRHRAGQRDADAGQRGLAAAAHAPCAAAFWRGRPLVRGRCGCGRGRGRVPAAGTVVHFVLVVAKGRAARAHFQLYVRHV